MLAHLGLCLLLRRGLTDNKVAEEDLLSVPNRPLGTPSSIRLLRARYYLPWQSLPSSATTLEPQMRTILGDRFWSVVYSLDSKTFQDLHFNGLA
jgi:hypothetical protein